VFKFVVASLVVLSSLSIFAAPSGEGGPALGDNLNQQRKTFSQKMPKDVVELHNQNIKDMKSAGLEKQALKIGDKVPDVEVNFHGTVRKLSQIYAVTPVVLKFYRGGWCPYCMAELKHYDSLNDEFKKAGAQIIAFSPDTEQMSGKTQSTNHLDFDVLSDANHAIARKFGLVYKVDQKVVDSLKKSGIDLSVYQGTSTHELAIPGTFVIGKDGRIIFSYVDADYRVRAEPSEVLKVVKSVNN
jgi:peroxiredoxin